MKRSDLIVMASILGMVVMIVIPINRTLLDILLIINLFLSMSILLVAMNTTKPLEFSIFPSLLLVTTLFRLALNLSSTRLILTQGNAGQVIQTFGHFVIGGNVVIGLIVFIIIAVVQFIVITKGSERVAEVAARFTLDAMPGKQISIDADLNSGLINEQEARARRQEIEGEADFYGAMDGASKFVRGDAIATLFIVVINIIGGFIIGMVGSHMSWQTAAQTYTTLSIGDALVDQIPALLLSTATGLIVTRAASTGNFGSDIVGQVFAYPRTIFIVSGAIAALGVITPIGVFRTWPVAIGFGILGWNIRRTAQAVTRKQEDEVKRQKVEDTKRPESLMPLLRVDPIEFEFGFSLIPLVDNKQGGDFLNRMSSIRKQLALELGYLIPVVKMQDNPKLASDAYLIKINGVAVAEGTIMPRHWLAMNAGNVTDDTVVGIPTKEPTFGASALWVSNDMRSVAEEAGYTIIDPTTVLATHMKHVLKSHGHELLGRKETKALLDNLKEVSASSLVDDLIPSLLSIAQVQRILINLLSERISIRSLNLILEILAIHAENTKDIDVLTELVRQGLSRQICNQFRVPNGPLRVVTLSPSVEGELDGSLVEKNGNLFVGLNAVRG